MSSQRKSQDSLVNNQQGIYNISFSLGKNMIHKRILGGTLLVAGTSIGAGMLALPVVTAAAGFFPALFIYFICWLFMTCTGLLLLEICLRFPPDANLVTMASHYLGRPGKVLAWGLYLFLFYCLSIAYIAGGGGLLSFWMGTSPWVGQMIFLFVLASIVFMGAKAVDRVNNVFMVGLILAYLVFVVLGLPFVSLDRIHVAQWSVVLIPLPVIFTSFSYQGIIPTLATYMHRDAKNIRTAILLGTSLAFAIYVMWEFLILGIVPLDGEFGLQRAKELGQTAVAPLHAHVAHSAISWVGQIFALFAIATSFLGVTLGLFDFLADGLKMAKKGIRRLFLAVLTFAVPATIALIHPAAFITALVFAGGIGCALLLGFLPTAMVWAARYQRNENLDAPQLGGGKAMLILLFLFVLLELAMEISHLA